jgi:hypothetical protein
LVAEGGLPGYDNSRYTLSAVGGTLSSTSADESESIRLTLDPGQQSWAVTFMDDEGCTHTINGTCGITETAEIDFTTILCCVDETFDVGVSPAGGVLSGPGVVGTTFNPSTAGRGTHTLTYRYRQDGCEIVDQLDVTVQDFVPEISCPEDITVECADPNNDAIITNWLASVEAIDECMEDLTITNNFSTLSANQCGGVSTVTFTVDDGKSNMARCSSTITHNDSTPPEFPPEVSPEGTT